MSADNMEAGRELDLEVLERVFGFPRRKVFTPYEGDEPYFIPSGKSKRTHMIDSRPVPRFSTDISAAWLVVERMREHPAPRFRTLRLVAYSYNRTYATFDADNEDDWTEANGPNATPVAICRAALAALEAA